MKIVLSLITGVLLLIGCKKEDKHLPPDFNYKIPEVNLSENVNVGAYYFNHSDSTWGATADTPTIGNYTSVDQTVMEQERQWANEGGIDFFIFNWNGSSDNALLDAFLSGNSGNVKMVINYNTSHLKATNNSPLAGSKLQTMTDELKTLASKYFNSDSYFKINGKPVVIFTPINLPSSALASIDYPSIMPSINNVMDSISTPIYTIGEITSGWLPPQRYDSSIRAMNAVTLTDWSTSVYDRYVFMPSFLDINWKNWTDSTLKWNIDYVPTIFPGYNDKIIKPTSKNYSVERSPELYTEFCNVAKRNLSDSIRLVLINSWNNFQLGTELEPSQEYGKTYLQITKDQFKVK